ncbi:MAG: DNA polymerase III subunit delta [Pseudomonadota bacterium]
MSRGPTAGAELKRLRGDLALGEPAPVLLFHGDEGFYRERAATLAVDHLLSDGLRDFNLDRRDGKETGPGDWVALASNRPMLGTRRVIVVTSADRWLKVGGTNAAEKAQQDQLADFAETSRSGTIVLQATSADKRSRLWKLLQKRGHAYEFPPMRSIEEAESFVTDRFSGEGIRLERGVARYLAEILGTSMPDLLTEIRRLCIFVGDRKVLTMEDVEGQVAATRTHTVFEFVDALGNRDAPQALAVLARLLEGGLKSDRKTDTQGVPLILVSLLHRQVRNMVLARSLVRDHGVEPRGLARDLGVPPFVAEKTLRQARRFPERRLQETLEELASVDQRLKSTSLPPRALLEGLIFRVCAADDR